MTRIINENMLIRRNPYSSHKKIRREGYTHNYRMEVNTERDHLMTAKIFRVTILMYTLGVNVELISQPAISSYAPTSGTVGTTVTIQGSNFNPISAKNVVWFGAGRALTTSSSATTITVKVPSGASYAPISVTDTATHLTAYSAKPFNIISPSIGVIDSSAFSAKVDVDPVGVPFGIELVDIDEDGRTDLAFTNGTSLSVKGNTSRPGSISFGNTYTITTMSTINLLAKGDFDGDGRIDIAGEWNNADIKVFRNLSSPGIFLFGAGVSVTTGTNPQFISVCDFDGDGKLDIATPNRNTNLIAIYRNLTSDSTIVFADTITIAGLNDPYGIAVGDIDGDGKPDIIVSNHASDSLSIFRNVSTVGNITFGPRFDAHVSSQPVYIAFGDLDGDGLNDLAVVTTSGAISVLRNTSSPGSLSFAAKVDFAVGVAGANIIAITDYDGDGKPDISVTSGTNVTLMRNRCSVGAISSSSFLVDVLLSAAATTSYVVAGDFDGDSKLDIATSGSQYISLFRNIIPGNLEQGLIAWYPFNGNVKDTTANGNNGTNIGANLTADRVGQPDKAFSFDGTTSKISTPLDFKIQPGVVRTVTAWFKTNDMINGNLFLGAGDDGVQHLGVGVYQGKLWTHSRNNSSGDIVAVSGNNSILPNVWEFGAFIIDGTDVSFFLNGVPDGGGSSLPVIDPVNTASIGSRTFDTWNMFNGSLDDIRIYNRALSEAEINALYFEGGWPLPVTISSFTSIVLGNIVSLRWITATEVDNYGFEVERKLLDGKATKEGAISISTTPLWGEAVWHKVGFVEGNGMTNIPHDYDFRETVSPGSYSYRLKQIDRDGKFAYSKTIDVNIPVPRVLSLSDNFPNPFNPTTTIEFTLPDDGRVSLRIYDVLGREVASLVEERLKAGELYRTVFDASKLASGVYFSRLEYGGRQLIKKLLLMK